MRNFQNIRLRCPHLPWEEENLQRRVLVFVTAHMTLQFSKFVNIFKSNEEISGFVEEILFCPDNETVHSECNPTDLKFI